MNKKNTCTSTSTWEVLPASEFESVHNVWRDLNEAMGSIPILDAVFFQLLLNHFGQGNVFVCVESRQGKPGSACLLTSGKPGVFETYQPSQAPLGAWVCGERGINQASLQSLIGKLPGFALLLGLTHLDPRVIDRPLESPILRTGDYIETARLETAGDFSEYWSTRGKNLRQNLRKQRNRLRAENTETRLEVVTDVADISKAVDEFALMEHRGWKSKTGTALHPNNPQGAFYRALLETYAASGEGRVYNYYFDEQVVASDLCLVRNGTSYILKTTYDEEYVRYSPAMLMREEQLRYLFADSESNSIEFYGRVMDWHRRLTNDIRTLFHVNQYRWPIVARLASRF